MIRSIALTLALLTAGCSSSTGTSQNGNGGGSAGSAGSGGGGSAGSSGGGGSVGGNGSDGGTTTPPIPPGGLVGNAKIGTYIVLGDSISDNGGTGPYFYDLLNADLAKKYPGLMYVHAAVAGAITDTYSDNLPPAAPLLKTQIAGLANNYPGDVLVTITIGGNDLNYHANKAIAMTDGQIRTEFGQHLDAELAELAMPGRLGSGKVYVVLANIYDFTDGMGDFAKVMCGPGANVSPTSDQMTFGEWNGVSATSLGKIANSALFDMHATFLGHGYNNTDASQVWYDRASCIHPNTAGHDAIRRAIYQIVTGETL